MPAVEVKRSIDIEPLRHLLLMADPSWELVQAYLDTGECYTAYLGERIVGVFVIDKISPKRFELMNIAVDETMHGQGIGSQIMNQVVRVCQQYGANELEVGTGNSSFDQLAFYQRNGFRFYDVKRDFFTTYYEEEIFENNIQCVDKLLLERPI